MTIPAIDRAVIDPPRRHSHEVVVTATREAQDLRTYAGSVSLVTNEEVALVGRRTTARSSTALPTP